MVLKLGDQDCTGKYGWVLSC